MAMNCLTCHEENAELAADGVPALAGLTQSQLLQALLDFKYDRKSATLMPRIAKGYGDDELRAVAGFLTQP